MNIHGKGKGKGAGGNGNIDVSVPGFNTIITTGGGYLSDIIEYLLFAVFIYYLHCKIMEAITVYSSIMAFTAPIIRYGMANVSNGFTESDHRFHIKCNSSFVDKECTRSSVTFDTGASMHVACHVHK